MAPSRYKLVCFDVDGTLIQSQNFWQLFHHEFDSDKATREMVKESFYAGKITYQEWAEHDVSLWAKKQVTRDDFVRTIRANHVQLMDGALETITALKKEGMKLAIISGSASIMLECLMPHYESLFDDVFINRLLFDSQGILCGVVPTPYDEKHKATALRMIAQREQVPLSETVFVGDYLNDIHALELAGLGIAFNSSHEEVKKAANVSVDSKNISDILTHILR